MRTNGGGCVGMRFLVKHWLGQRRGQADHLLTLVKVVTVGAIGRNHAYASHALG